MRKTNREQKKVTANVEFGNELGDMNASKLFEIPFMNDKKKIREKKK